MSQVVLRINSKVMALRILFTLCLISSLSLGCKSTQPATPLQIAEAPAGFSVIGDSLPADPGIDHLISPYRARLEQAINEVIGQTDVQLQKGGLESNLGNMAADAMLQQANKYASTPVDMALTNNGGLRVAIAPGPITVGEIFELMPFENTMVVLELSGAQVDSLAQQIAAAGGEPIAGFSFLIEEKENDEEANRATNIQVNNAPLDLARTYRLVTSDYMANGGGRLSALWHPVNREDLNMLLRDAFIAYIRTTGTITTKPDGRISTHKQPETSN